MVLNAASSAIAAANSFNVSKAAGAPLIRLLIAVLTKAVVAILVVLFPAVWVVAVDNLAAATVPEAKLLALRLVRLTPLAAGNVAGNLASGIVPELKLLASKEFIIEAVT